MRHLVPEMMPTEIDVEVLAVVIAKNPYHRITSFTFCR